MHVSVSKSTTIYDPVVDALQRLRCACVSGSIPRTVYDSDPVVDALQGVMRLLVERLQEVDVRDVKIFQPSPQARILRAVECRVKVHVRQV